jgi:hypothetical protein
MHFKCAADFLLSTQIFGTQMVDLGPVGKGTEENSLSIQQTELKRTNIRELQRTTANSMSIEQPGTQAFLRKGQHPPSPSLQAAITMETDSLESEA